MGKSQSAKLEQKFAQFRKELRARNCRVLTTAEAARQHVMRELNRKRQEIRSAQANRSLIEAIMLGGKPEIGTKQIKHGEDKSQSKNARSIKRLGRKQMA